MLVEDGRVFMPSVADVFIWSSPLQRLEPFGKVVCLYESVKVLTQLRVALVEVAIHGLVFDGPMHSFNLPIRPWMVGFGQPVLNTMCIAYGIKSLLASPLCIGRLCKLVAVVSQDGVNLIGHRRDEAMQESTSIFALVAGHQFDINELGSAINGNEEIEFAFIASEMADVQVKVADGIGFEALLRWLAFRLRQAVYAMTLKATMQAGAGQMWDRLLQGVETVIKRQQGLGTEGNDHGLLLLAEDGRARLFGTHRQVLDGIALLPFCDRLRVDAIALGQLGYALLTILYLLAGRLCRSGLRVENLSHNASFSHFEMTP